MAIRLIAFPGGGSLGAFQAAILQRIPYKTIDKAGAVAGTSIGSVMACAVAAGKAGNILAFFLEHVGKIFAGYPWRHYLGYPMPRYADRALNAALQELFVSEDGKTLLRFGDCRIPTFIVTVHASGRPKILYSGDQADGMIPMWEVVRASCAAPTFFERWRGKSDGGLVANNPVFVGVTGLVSELGYSIDQITAIKIGAGSPPLIEEEEYDKEHARGPWDYTRNIIFAHKAQMNGAVDVMHDKFTSAYLRHYCMVDFEAPDDMNMDDPRVAGRVLREFQREIHEGAIKLATFLEGPVL